MNSLVLVYDTILGGVRAIINYLVMIDRKVLLLMFCFVFVA